MKHEYCVLVVDDDSLFLDAAEEALRKDYAVSTATGGYDALRLLADGLSPDLILLDIDMPGINGFEILRRLQEDPETAHIPVLFLTGLDPGEYEARGFTLGAHDYIQKPFVQGALPLRVRRHIETARRLREKNTLDEERLRQLSQPLTQTELKVARLLAKGYSNEEIVEELHYSMSYVKKLTVRVVEKLGLDHRGKIVKYLK